MELMTCVEKIRDKKDKITAYVLMNAQYKTIILSNSTLKNGIRNKKIEIDNLTLTKDNRLASKKIDNEKVYITRSIIMDLKSDKALSFKSNVNLDKVISKANILGAKIDKLKNNLYTMINETSIVVLSDKQIKLPENSDWIFRDTEFSKINLSNVDTSSTVSMVGTFSECKTKELDLSNFNTSKVISMRKLFDNCRAKRINISNFDTSKVENMDSMFFNCKLDSIQGLQELDTSNVVDMGFMFCNFEYNDKLDLRNFNTSNVRFTMAMFKNCKVKELNLSSFNTDIVVDMTQMFNGCETSVIDMRNFNMQNTNKQYMFHNCEAKILR